MRQVDRLLLLVSSDDSILLARLNYEIQGTVDLLLEQPNHLKLKLLLVFKISNV